MICSKCGLDKPIEAFQHGRKQCRDCRNTYQRGRYEHGARERILATNRASNQRYPDELSTRGRLYHQKAKREAMEAYGGCCQCCGVSDLVFLTIDHINGGGTRHRKQLSSAGTSIYLFLRKEHYPSGYRVLCFNCNWATFHGGCPHSSSSGARVRAYQVS